MSTDGKGTSPRKIVGIIGVVLTLGGLTVGTWIMIMVSTTVLMARTMKAQLEGATTMIDYTCNTCGVVDGSFTAGTRGIVNGSPCGYISGQAVICRGTYTVQEREMTEEEMEDAEQAREGWDRMIDRSVPIKTGGILTLIAGLIMGVGAFGCLKDKGWGLPVEIVALLLGIVGMGIGISTVVAIFSGS